MVWLIYFLSAVTLIHMEMDLHHPLELMMTTIQQMVTTILTRNHQHHLQNLLDQDHIMTDSTRNRHPVRPLEDRPHPQGLTKPNLYISDIKKFKIHVTTFQSALFIFLLFFWLHQEIVVAFVLFTRVISRLEEFFFLKKTSYLGYVTWLLYLMLNTCSMFTHFYHFTSVARVLLFSCRSHYIGCIFILSIMLCG